MKTTTILSLTCAAILGLSACGDSDKTSSDKKPSSDKKIEDINDTITLIDQAGKVEFDNLFANVPSPFIMAKQIQTSGIEADPSILSDFEKAATYTTERKKALNLGLYCADLTYAHVMEVRAEEFKYLSAIAFLSEKLGVEKALSLDERVGDFETHSDDKEATMAIINDIYADLEAYLKEERREEIAAYMMAGGVVEMLYLSTQTSTDNPDILRMLADQSNGIDAIIAIISRLEEDQEDEIIQDLKKIKAVFSNLETTTETIETTEEDGVVTLGGKTTTAIFSAEQAAMLKDIVSSIRNRYTE